MSCKKCMDYDTVIGFEEQGYKCCPYCGENIRLAIGLSWAIHIENEILDGLKRYERKNRTSEEFVEIDGEILEYDRKPWSNNMPSMKLDMDVCIDKEIKMLNDYFNITKGDDIHGKKTDS